MQRAQNPLAARARRRRRVGGLPQNPPLRQISERRGFDMLGGEADFVARANPRRARQIAQARDQRVVFRAAAAQNNKRRFRFANLGGDCRGGEFEQSRLRHARVLAAQNRLEAADIEFLAAATFGRSPPQKTPRAVAFQQLPQQARRRLRLSRPFAAAIERRVFVLLIPSVHQHIAGADIPSARRLVGAQNRRVGDAADIDDGARREARESELMKAASERRALPAGGDIAGAKIAYDIDSG